MKPTKRVRRPKGNRKSKRSKANRKGSTQPVRKVADMVTSQVALNAITATQLFAKEGGNSGDPTIDDIRVVKNMDAAIDIFIGATSAVTAATGFLVSPKESFILAGPSGIAMHGNVWAIAASGAPNAGKLSQ